MVRDCCSHLHKLAVRRTHVKLVNRPATKVRMLIPFPILLLYRTNWITCSKLPLYVSLFPGLFIFRLRTGSMLPKFFVIHAAQIFRHSVGSNTRGALCCPTVPQYSYRYSVGRYHTKEHLCCPHFSKSWYAPPFSLYCRTHRAHAAQNCQNMGPNSFCMSHIGYMLAKCASY